MEAVGFSPPLLLIVCFVLLALVGGLLVVFAINRSWGGSLDRGPAMGPIAPPALTGDLAGDARALLQSRNKIAAIKRVRELTGWGLKEAKDYVDALERGAPPPPPPAAPPAAGPLAPAELEYAARALAQQGNKIEAIKLVREQTGLGLKEAKDYVDRL